MGAYFTTQIFEQSDSKEVVAEFSHGDVPFLNYYAGFLNHFTFSHVPICWLISIFSLYLIKIIH